MNERDIFRNIIESNYSKPENLIILPPEGYREFYIEEKECIDDFRVFVNIENQQILDAKFYGSGCAISTSSLNILCNMLKNKNLKEANNLIDNYSKLILEGKLFDDMGDLAAFQGVHKQLNRISCGIYASKLFKGVLNGRI